ncbi:MAG: tetratricopeptide repeat protein [Bacteroidota bacterium]
MSKLQSIVLAASLGLFCLLYFGFSPKPREIVSIESERAVSASTVNVNNLIRDVQGDLTKDQKSYLITLEKEVEASENESNKIEMLKRLSGKWFEYGQPHIAGFYAEKVAEIENTLDAWSITGTTFAATFRGQKDKKIKDFALERATAAFENAVSLNPDAIQPKVNLALCYVEYPQQDNPMKGILMLIELNKEYPDNPIILTNLGRLAIQTGQFDKAVQRLSKAIEIEPTNRNATCLLAQAYEGQGDTPKASQYAEKCQRLSSVN